MKMMAEIGSDHGIILYSGGVSTLVRLRRIDIKCLDWFLDLSVAGFFRTRILSNPEGFECDLLKKLLMWFHQLPIESSLIHY